MSKNTYRVTTAPSLSAAGHLSNCLAPALGRLYVPGVKNEKGQVDQAPPDESLEERLGPEIDEALFLLDELATDDPEEALATFDTLPVPVQALVDFQLLAARAHQALGEVETARDILLSLLNEHAENPDVHHQLGDVFEDLGDVEKGNAHFEKTRALDLSAYEKLTSEERKKSVVELEEALAKIAATLTPRRLQVTVETMPSQADVIAGIDPRALCHYRKETESLVGYAGNVAFEFGDLDDGEPHDALVLGLIEYAATELGLSEHEIGLFGVGIDESDIS